MKIKFEKVNTPNFIRTNMGLVDVKDLSTKEFLEYCHIFKVALAEKRFLNPVSAVKEYREQMGMVQNA